MKKIQIVLISFLVLLTTAGIMFYYTNFHYYKHGENDAFTCNVGETFDIRLRENGSTGCINCWLNENQCRVVKKVDSAYEPSINARLGYDGAGGIIILTFQAIAPGRDTIKMSNCFVADKECKDYTPENTSSDNEFIIEVNE